MTWQRAPLLPLAAAFAAGLAARPWVPLAASALALVTAGLVATAAVTLRAGQARLAGSLLIATFCALGALRGTAPIVPADHIARRALPPMVTIEGRLAEEPIRWAPDRTRLLMDAEAVIDDDERKPVSGRVQVAIYGEMEPLGEGQRISAAIRLHRPIGFRNPGVFDYPAHLRREGILRVGSGRGDEVKALTADGPPWPVAVRRWAITTLRAELPEATAGLLAGLLLGERTALPRETDDTFRRAGVYHVLAVSGFNVALLASSTFLGLSMLGVPRRGTALAAGAVLIGFALVVGAEPSVLRATVMGLLLLLAIVLEREAQLLNSVAVAALALLLWRPGDLWDPGFQLSFAATIGIIALTPATTAFIEARGCPRWLAASLAVSLGAQLAVTPIMLAHFNQLSLIGVAANLAVVPLAALATTLGLVSLLAAVASDAAAGLLFNALWPVLLLLRLVVWGAAAVPAAMIHLPAPPTLAVAAWFGGLALWTVLRDRAWARHVAVVLLAVAIGLGAWPWLRPGDGKLRVIFLDVGQGDATLIELPEGPRMLVDGGPGGTRRFDVGARVLAPFLWNRPVGRLDVVALSHSDPDHSGGLAAVLRHFRVGEFWENGRWGAGSEETLRALTRSGVSRRVLDAGQRIWLGDALITVLHPDGQPLPGENDNSLVLRLDWRGVSLLLPGDLGARGEARLLERGAPVRALVLKVAHHGSRFSTAPTFLAAARPALAVISAGARNPFGHPARETLERLVATGTKVYRTDRDGAIILESDGRRFSVTRWGRGATEVLHLDSEALLQRSRPPA